jgi:4-amino-4-deoxy-L-arabinose transferase-like glycosyltransferase
MSMLARPARMPWWAAVALLALGARLLFLFGADEPLLYSHPYNYFHGALSIVEHADPWRFVWSSDAWHLWLGPWTIAPLYYLFLAGAMAVFGPHLLPIQLLQIALDVVAAVLTGLLGRRLAGPRGAWAGAAYAVNFHAIEQCTTTLTENVSNVLLLAGIVMLLEEARDRRRGWMAAAGGVLMGLSALARAVATAFVPLAGLWRWSLGRDRPALVRAIVICAAAAAAVVPWTIRNAIVTGDFIPVETNGIYNLYDDNTFVEGERRARQEAVMRSQPTLAAQRAMATRMALRGIARQPGAFVEKAWRNLLHLVRPDGLQLLLVVEEPMPAWRHAALVFLDDLIVLPAVVLFAVFLIAGPRSPERGLIAAWTAYYLLMVVVLFHNEIRYRSTLLPFALAGAAGGWALLARREGSPGRVRLALALGGGLVALVVAPYVVPGARALRSLPALTAMREAVVKGDAASAQRDLEEAARTDPSSARPWLRYGRALAAHGDALGAMAAYETARERRSHVWVPIVVRPALLAAAGRTAEVLSAVEEANAFSWNVDPWLALEVAWRELPAPVADEVRLGLGDYGAARGFSNPFRGYRWTRHRSWLRVHPTTAAAAYDVTLWMGSPVPSPLEAPVVRVTTADGQSHFTLSRAVAPFHVRATPDATGVVTVRLDAPTWNRRPEPAEQGVRVDRMTVTPVPVSVSVPVPVPVR